MCSVCGPTVRCFLQISVLYFVWVKLFQSSSLKLIADLFVLAHVVWPWQLACFIQYVVWDVVFGMWCLFACSFICELVQVLSLVVSACVLLLLKHFLLSVVKVVDIRKWFKLYDWWTKLCVVKCCKYSNSTHLWLAETATRKA